MSIAPGMQCRNHRRSRRCYWRRHPPTSLRHRNVIELVPAGSGTDTVGRIIATGLSEVLGQQVVVENRAGAAGNIGAEIVARAPADGYTLLQSNIAYAANVSLYRNLSYDLVRDFAPVTQFATGPYVVVVHPSVPVKSFAEAEQGHQGA